DPFVRRARRVRGDELDLRRRDRKLVGGNLDERRLDALAELGLAREHGDRAGPVDLDPRVEERRIPEASGQRTLRAHGTRVEREGHDDGAGGGDEAAARRIGKRCRRHQPLLLAPLLADCMMRAARSTAFSMRMCVPHRQRLAAMCLRISSRDGVAFASSSACALIIMPGMQKPHCAACSSMNARCTGPGASIVPKPSMVVTLRAPTTEIGVTHENTALPSIITVHAPHCPRTQPNLAPLLATARG